MVKTLIVLILLFDGTLVKEKLEFDKQITILECLEFSNKHREEIATHFWVKNRAIILMMVEVQFKVLSVNRPIQRERVMNRLIVMRRLSPTTFLPQCQML